MLKRKKELNNLQKYISYLFRLTVEKTSSKYNKELIVAIQGGKYVLNAQNANYSFASLHRVFRQALTKANVKQKEIKDVLVLGCGAGSIPKIIYQEYGLMPDMDAVEIDDKVIELAKKYFNIEEYEKLNLFIGDAMSYVEECNKKYDLILIDVFDGINVPDKFLTQHFFTHVKSLLNDRGEVLLNYVAYNYDTRQQVEVISDKLKKIYNQVNTYRFEDINRVFHFHH